MTRNIRKSRERCLCGLRVSLHFTTTNRKLDCDTAKAAHPRATVRPVTFADLTGGAK